MKSNHHTHTLFSDGKAQPEDYVNEALERGFDVLGFTEHSPLPFMNPFSFQRENRESYLQTIRSLQGAVDGRLKLYLGMEMDYIPGLSEDFSSVRAEFGCDYLIGSVHLVRPVHSDQLWFTDGPNYETYDEGIEKLFAGDVRRAVTTYYQQVNEMIVSQDFEILGHFDKIKMHNRGRFFSEDEPWYCDLVNETIWLIREKNLVVEVNTRGIYKKRSETTYPGLEILKELRNLGIPVMVNSDAHQPHELDAAYEEGFSVLKAAGICETVSYNSSGWVSDPIL